MSVATFRATCNRLVSVGFGPTRIASSGLRHCDGIVFEGAEGVAALKAHTKAAHPRTVPANHAQAGFPLKPFSHKAPRATAGGLEKVEAKIAAGEYLFPANPGHTVYGGALAAEVAA